MPDNSPRKPTTDDYAKLAVDYTDDADLFLIANALDAEHGAGLLVWAYWPHLIATAKKSKAFGWFRKAPMMLAQDVNDRGCVTAWEPRRRMYELLRERGRIIVRQGVIVTPEAMVDVRLVNWPEWQSKSTKEHSRLGIERRAVKAGKTPHWTVAHLDEFRTGDGDSSVTPPAPPATADGRTSVTDGTSSVTDGGTIVHNRTQDETYPLPPTAPDASELTKAYSLYGKALDLAQRRDHEVAYLESVVGDNPEVRAVLERMRSAPTGLLGTTESSGERLHVSSGSVAEVFDIPGAGLDAVAAAALDSPPPRSQPRDDTDTSEAGAA